MAGDAVTLEKDGTIQVTWTGADNDWNYVTDTPAYAKTGYLCSSIAFEPSAANDVLVVNEGGNDGPSICTLRAGVKEDRVHYFSPAKWIRPYIDYSDCTFSTGTSVKVVFTIV